MMIARSQTRSGQPLALLVMDPENIRRLQNDEPIVINLAERIQLPGAPVVVIHFAQDLKQLTADMLINGQLRADTTVLIDDAPPDHRCTWRDNSHHTECSVCGRKNPLS